MLIFHNNLNIKNMVFQIYNEFFKMMNKIYLQISNILFKNKIKY
jgi:hypothetical protein